MSRHRQQRRVHKLRRHLQPNQEPSARAERPLVSAAQSQIVVREASHVERLAYTRSQAAQALGISRSTLRRLLPYIETIELPWGTHLIPADELERLVGERRRAGRVRPTQTVTGRPRAIDEDVLERIRAARAAGKSLARIADELNSEGIPTAHGGAQWWPSTVRAALQRRER